MRNYCLCSAKLPQVNSERQARVTHRLHSLASLREATRTAVRFDVTAEPPRGLRAAASVDNASPKPTRRETPTYIWHQSFASTCAM